MAADNEGRTGTPDQGMHDDAEPVEESHEGSYEEADRDTTRDDVGSDHDDPDEDSDDTGHYAESDTGSGRHDTHPEHGDYVQRDQEGGAPPD